MAQASECPFCKIARNDVPADVVHSSDNVVAFRDINPQAPTHILLISKEHIESVASLGEQHGKLLSEIVRTARHLAEAENIDRSGWRLVTNVGANAGQSVLHLHFHLLGGRGFSWPPG